MGLFKDMHQLSKMGKEMRDKYPVEQRLANAQASMTQANQMLAGMAAATAVASANGVDSFATVTGARQTGMFINYNPVVELDLLVTLPSGVPVPVTRQEPVPQISLYRTQPGTRVRVKVDPANPSALVVDWLTPA